MAPGKCKHVTCRTSYRARSQPGRFLLPVTAPKNTPSQLEQDLTPAPWLLGLPTCLLHVSPTGLLPGHPLLITHQPHWPPICFPEKPGLFPSLSLLFLPGVFSAALLTAGSFSFSFFVEAYPSCPLKQSSPGTLDLSFRSLLLWESPVPMFIVCEFQEATGLVLRITAAPTGPSSAWGVGGCQGTCY